MSNISHTTGISYSLNFNRIIFDVLPVKLRKIRIFQYLQSIFSPLKELHTSFLAYRESTLFEIRITGQTGVLQKYLRMKYNNEGINVINAYTQFTNTYIYNRNEIGSTALTNYIYRKGETPATEQIFIYRKSESTLTYDFKIELPSELILAGVSIAEIEAIVNNYKVLGVVYTIEVV